MNKEIFQTISIAIVITLTNLGTSDLLWGTNICNNQLDEISAKTHLRIHTAHVNGMLEETKKIQAKKLLEDEREREVTMRIVGRINMPTLQKFVPKTIHQQGLQDPYPELMPGFEYLIQKYRLIGLAPYSDSKGYGNSDPYEPLYNGFKHTYAPYRKNEDELPLQPTFEYCIACGVAWEFLKQRK